ncbi:MAG: hypothetical protein Q8O10_10250 [candidate division Zixibacteria bacterium]|nr:hypothetical protein [candidate division Zixibacteria bacterium]
MKKRVKKSKELVIECPHCGSQVYEPIENELDYGPSDNEVFAMFKCLKCRETFFVTYKAVEINP